MITTPGHAGPTTLGGNSPPLSTPIRLLLIVVLISIAAVCWLYLLLEASRMSDMPSGMPEMMEMRSRDASELVLLFLMWAVMMVAMMTPSAVPMILVYTAVTRKVAHSRSLVWLVTAFVLGYIIVWTLFSIAATLLQAWLEHLALLSPMMVSESPRLGGGLLIAAGLYQLTPIKDICLKHCQTPLAFIAIHWRDGLNGALWMGIHHGLYCVGCCWVLMALLFIGGVMNLLWIALIAGFVLLEKITPLGSRAGRWISGLGLMTVGLWFLLLLA